MFRNTTRTAVLALAAAAFVSGPALAQEQQPQQPPQIEVNDSQLDAFVDATVEIVDIREDYQSRAASVESPEEMGELETQANAEMIDAVEGAGLQVEEYNQIAQAAQQDPELDQQIVEMMTERQEQ
ncbi:DUF4168 domain-containing protein [Fodinicurvata sp. EGI_FJ10296]|uniref:DUF4168 domain-containing protein n=1 Tax=Fodinicurvata sp. EGI_FJ10296 TaxID=3231908 RepID=UPI00345233E4